MSLPSPCVLEGFWKPEAQVKRGGSRCRPLRHLQGFFLVSVQGSPHVTWVVILHLFGCLGLLAVEDETSLVVLTFFFCLTRGAPYLTQFSGKRPWSVLCGAWGFPRSLGLRHGLRSWSPLVTNLTYVRAVIDPAASAKGSSLPPLRGTSSPQICCSQQQARTAALERPPQGKRLSPSFASRIGGCSGSPG